MGNSKTEYAKLITHYVPQTTIFGIRTVVTIPSGTSIGVNETTNGNGFNDPFLSLNRKGDTYHYECGLSQAAGHAGHYGLSNTPSDGKFHWMYAAGSEGADGGAYNLSLG